MISMYTSTIYQIIIAKSRRSAKSPTFAYYVEYCHPIPKRFRKTELLDNQQDYHAKITHSELERPLQAVNSINLTNNQNYEQLQKWGRCNHLKE